MNASQITKMLSRRMEDIISERELEGIVVTNNGEALVPIIDYVPNLVVAMSKHRRRSPEETLYARSSVAEALSRVSQRALPLRLKLFDAFRPIEIQQKWYEEVYERISLANPSWSEEKAKAKTYELVFTPSLNPLTPPAHSTGGAIDLTLTTETGNDLEMGSAYGDFDNPLIYTNAFGVSTKVRENRVKLITLMAEQGFVNYPGEWWHFSLFDREWAAYQGKQLAKYARAEDPYKT